MKLKEGEINLSVVTYNDGLGEFIMETPDGNMSFQFDASKISDHDQNLLWKYMPPCVYTKYSR